MKRKQSAAIAGTVVITAIVMLLLNENPSQYSTELAVGITLMLFPLWGWAFKSELRHLFKDESTKSAAVKPLQIASVHKTELNQQDKRPIILLPKDKTVKNSIHLPNEDEPQKLSIDNNFIDELYGRAHKLASSIYYDSELSSVSIQVFPFWKTETADATIKSTVTIFFYFYSKNAEKYFQVSYDEVNGVTHTFPDEDATCDYQRVALSKFAWRGVYWKGFLSKAYDKVKPLAKSNKTYYNILISPTTIKEWSAIFFDGVSGRRRTYYWDGKGIDESSINVE